MKASSRWARGKYGVAGFAVLGGVAGTLLLHRVDPDCSTASRTSPAAEAALVCERAYVRSQDPATGALLADAQLASGNPSAASALANHLLATPARGDALRVLGEIAALEHRPEVALPALERARDLHRSQDRRAALALDDQAIVEVQLALAQLAPALRAADECVAEARFAALPRVEARCRVSAARALATAGSFEAARRELDRAAHALPGERDAAWLQTRYTEIERDRDRDRGREVPSSGAEPAAEHGPAQDDDDRIAGCVRQARAALAAGDLAAAKRWARRGVEQAEHVRAAPPIELPPWARDGRGVEHAEHVRAAPAIELPPSGRDGRGVEHAEHVRAAPAIELRPWVLDGRREPYELWFSALARAGRVDDALAALDRWQGRALLDALSRPDRTLPLDLRDAASRIETTSSWLSIVAAAPGIGGTPGGGPPSGVAPGGVAPGGVATSGVAPGGVAPGGVASGGVAPGGVAPSGGASGGVAPGGVASGGVAPGGGARGGVAPSGVASALRSADVLALVVADRELWRVTSSAGRVDLADLGPFAAVRDRIERFIAAPTDRALAGELGRVLLGDAAPRATRDALRVVLDGPLARLPVGALRSSGGRALISARPIVRATRLAAVACATPAPGAHRAVVIADAAGDLPGARHEAEDAAGRLGATSWIGAGAASPELFAAAPGDLLHLAVRAAGDADDSALALHDRSIRALEIAARTRGPALVVLSVRGGPGEPAAGRDLAGLAGAFVAAGSTQVVAALRPLADDAARAVMARFYAAGGPDDPVGVLAEIQAQLATTEDTDWPALAVFGRDLCPTGRR